MDDITEQQRQIREKRRALAERRRLREEKKSQEKLEEQRRSRPVSSYSSSKALARGKSIEDQKDYESMMKASPSSSILQLEKEEGTSMANQDTKMSSKTPPVIKPKPNEKQKQEARDRFACKSNSHSPLISRRGVKYDQELVQHHEYNAEDDDDEEEAATDDIDQDEIISSSSDESILSSQTSSRQNRMPSHQSHCEDQSQHDQQKQTSSKWTASSVDHSSSIKTPQKPYTHHYSKAGSAPRLYAPTTQHQPQTHPDRKVSSMKTISSSASSHQIPRNLFNHYETEVNTNSSASSKYDLDNDDDQLFADVEAELAYASHHGIDVDVDSFLDGGDNSSIDIVHKRSYPEPIETSKALHLKKLRQDRVNLGRKALDARLAKVLSLNDQ